MVERPVSGMLTCMESRRLVALLGLLALLVLDVVLVAWALWPTSLPPGGTPRGALTSSTDAPSLAEGGAARPTPSDAAFGSPAPVTRHIAAVNAQIVWLADAGSCGSPGSVHVSSTGGEEWTTRRTPGSVTRLRPRDASSGFVVGGDQDCAAQVWYTGDGGESWSAAQSAADAWGREPSQAQQILRPGGDPVEPCLGSDVIDLAGLSGAAAWVLCGDGAIRATTDRGANWSTSETREGTLAISMVAPGEGAATGVDVDCSGVTVTAIVGGRLGESSCVEAATAAPGQVAVSVTDGAVWLAAGNGVFRADRINAPFARRAPWPTT